MTMKFGRLAMMAAAVVLTANGLWADEVPEPITDAGEGVPMVIKAMLCLLPAVGAWSLYRVMRRRA